MRRRRGGGRSRRKERGGREEEEEEDDNGKRRRRWRGQGVVTLIYIYAVVMALTRLLTPYTKKGVELLCIVLYIIRSRAKCVCSPTVNE